MTARTLFDTEAPAATTAAGPRPRILALDLSITATGLCLPNGTTETITTRIMRAVLTGAHAAVIGKGNADKTAMAIAALKRAGREFADDNRCDAFWLRAAGLDWYGRPEFEVPKAQRDRLSKVTWPELPAGVAR